MGRRLLLLVISAFGLMIAVGATGEMMMALRPSLLPRQALAVSFIAAHQTSAALRAWMIASNLSNLAVGVTFMLAAAAIRRGQARAWRRLRTAAMVLGGVALLGVPVCLPHLLPVDSEAALFMLVSVSGAAGAVFGMSLFLVMAARRGLTDRGQ